MIALGTIAVGSQVEVRVSAIAYPHGISSTSSRITNIAELYRGDGTCDTINPLDPCRVYENNDKARLDPKTDIDQAICGDGVLDENT